MLVRIDTESQRLIDTFKDELEDMGFEDRTTLLVGINQMFIIDPECKNFKQISDTCQVVGYFLPRDWDKIFNQIEKELQPDYEKGDWVWVKGGVGHPFDGLVKYTINNQTYGFNHLWNWTENFSIRNAEQDGRIERKATEKEVHIALEQEFFKRYDEGDEVKGLNVFDGKVSFTKGHPMVEEGFITAFSSSNDELYCIEKDDDSKGICVYSKGKWADVMIGEGEITITYSYENQSMFHLEDEKPTFEQQLKSLTEAFCEKVEELKQRYEKT